MGTEAERETSCARCAWRVVREVEVPGCSIFGSPYRTTRPEACGIRVAGLSLGPAPVPPGRCVRRPPVGWSQFSCSIPCLPGHVWARRTSFASRGAPQRAPCGAIGVLRPRALRTKGRVSGARLARASRIPARAATASRSRPFSVWSGRRSARLPFVSCVAYLSRWHRVVRKRRFSAQR